MSHATRMPRLTPEQFRRGVEQCQLDIPGIKQLTGAQASRVKDWLEGRDTPPFYWFWALPLLSSVYNRDFALHLAEQVLTDPDFDPTQMQFDSRPPL